MASEEDPPSPDIVVIESDGDERMAVGQPYMRIPSTDEGDTSDTSSYLYVTSSSDSEDDEKSKTPPTIQTELITDERQDPQQMPEDFLTAPHANAQDNLSLATSVQEESFNEGNIRSQASFHLKQHFISSTPAVEYAGQGDYNVTNQSKPHVIAAQQAESQEARHGDDTTLMRSTYYEGNINTNNKMGNEGLALEEPEGVEGEGSSPTQTEKGSFGMESDGFGDASLSQPQHYHSATAPTTQFTPQAALKSCYAVDNEKNDEKLASEELEGAEQNKGSPPRVEEGRFGREPAEFDGGWSTFNAETPSMPPNDSNKFYDSKEKSPEDNSLFQPEGGPQHHHSTERSPASDKKHLKREYRVESTRDEARFPLNEISQTPEPIETSFPYEPQSNQVEHSDRNRKRTSYGRETPRSKSIPEHSSSWDKKQSENAHGDVKDNYAEAKSPLREVPSTPQPMETSFHYEPQQSHLREHRSRVREYKPYPTSKPKGNNIGVYKDVEHSGESRDAAISGLTKMRTLAAPKSDDHEGIFEAIVYVAAPKSVQVLAICGEDPNLGSWKQPRGSFATYVSCNGDLHIFKGRVPVPSQVGSDFKLCSWEKKKFTYEGENPADNRNDDLLPGSVNYFVFKTGAGKLGTVKKFLGYSDANDRRKIIAVEFIGISCNQVLQEKNQDWDLWFETLIDAFEKIRTELKDNNLRDAFSDYFEQQVKMEATKQDFRRLLILLTGSYILDFHSGKLKELIENIAAFSYYFAEIAKGVRRNRQHFERLMESLASVYPILTLIMFLLSGSQDQQDKQAAQNSFQVRNQNVTLHQQRQRLCNATTLLLPKIHVNDIYGQLTPFLEVNESRRNMLYEEFLSRFRMYMGSEDKMLQILKSDLMADMSRRAQSSGQFGSLPTFLRVTLNLGISSLLSIAVQMPDHLLWIATPIIEEHALAKFNSGWDEKTYKFLGKLDINKLNKYPTLRNRIEVQLLSTTNELLLRYEFQKVPTVRLILVSLSRREDIIYLDQPTLGDLRNVMASQPREFFDGLTSALQANGRNIEQSLRAHRQGKLVNICDTIQQHFDYIDAVTNYVNKRYIPVNEAIHLLDARVQDCLIRSGLPEAELSEIRHDVEEIGQLSELYGNLYNQLALYEATVLQEDTEADADGNSNGSETFEVFDIELWEDYLKTIDLAKSTELMSDALQKAAPMPRDCASWLAYVIKSRLFIDKVWIPQVKKSKPNNLSEEDLTKFIKQAAQSWYDMAQSIDEGRASFSLMEDVIQIEPDTKLLCSHHFTSKRQFNKISHTYENFRNISKIRHLINPFVIALRSFKISNQKSIERIHRFVKNELVLNWDDLTLARLNDVGIMKTIYVELDITRNPENVATIEFIASFVTSTDGDSSPLIEWLRNKTEQDFEAMGKILQGHLFEAYGQLQTLKTRIAPFLQQTFKTYQDLLAAIRESERKFLERHSGRVHDIKFEWLASNLPEIEAAIKASVTSPSEDAKEKLEKLDQVHISFNSEHFQIKIRLQGGSELSIEEVKQAFQLLDIVVSDKGDKIVIDIRRNVELIVRLAEVFAALFNSRYIAHSPLKDEISFEMIYLEVKLNEMRSQLDEWNRFWQRVVNLPYLALFSRDFLLELAVAVNQGELESALEFLRIVLPSAPPTLDEAITGLMTARNTQPEGGLVTSADHLFELLNRLNKILKDAFEAEKPTIELPALKHLGQTLETEFAAGQIVILNIDRDLLVGISLAAYTCLTGEPVEPARILFVTACTGIEELKRFMQLWSVGNTGDLFIMVHVEKLSTSMATVIRDAIGRVLPEERARLLLLAQKRHRAQSTKSLGARLGLISDRSPDTQFSPKKLRECFAKLLSVSGNIHFFTSAHPGCGKTQQAMRLSAEMGLEYYRVAVREGTVEELMEEFKKIELDEVFLHLDVGHSVSLEFNDILLSFILHGALYEPRKSHLGYWKLGPKVIVGIEFTSPMGVRDFPIISYLGTHHECECSAATFSYQLAQMPQYFPGYVELLDSNEFIVAAKFLEIKSGGLDSLGDWDEICNEPETIVHRPVNPTRAFELLTASFDNSDNQKYPTFTSLKALATFIQRHVTAMAKSLWFNSSAQFLFKMPTMVNQFKQDIFELLTRVANDSLARCWSLMKEHHKKQTDFDWERRQKALLLLGVDDTGAATSVNVAGRCSNELLNMFHATLRPHLRQQSLQFQELCGVNKLLESKEGTETVLNAIRSLLHLDGSPKCLDRARQLDNHEKNTPAIDRLHALLGPDLGYVLTGDNLTKMMFALYRIRCGLPVIVFGEAGVGKSALFRFLIQTLLGHHLSVLNVNSGTTIPDVKVKIREALDLITEAPEDKFFLFFDEMNTADPTIIAFFKEVMLDRHFDGESLPENLHMMAAANPYRRLKKTNDDYTSVGLSFSFAESKSSSPQNKDLVYRVNQLPRSFYDHLYDFGYMSQQAEDVYIEEMCQHSLGAHFSKENVKTLIGFIQKCHSAVRKMSPDPDSAVSLRDAARAVQLFQWFHNTPAGRTLVGNGKRDISAQLAIYVAYAFRFTIDRDQFLELVFGKYNRVSSNVKDASRKITNLLSHHANGASIGSGAIAMNDALCENLLALFVCVLNGIFVIIVGRPGTSKSLSVEILKLLLSPSNHRLREKLGDVPALSELYFQCSPLSTSAGFKALFESARKFSKDAKTLMTMVVLDELGLADLSPEKPIKVLHSELERKAILTSGELQQTPYSVVALSNWVVDAAQVNRGILIRRRKADQQDLLKSAEELAQSLVRKFNGNKGSIYSISPYLNYIVDIYRELDDDEEIGGGHFYSMRDFFFCVKNFVCSTHGFTNAYSGNNRAFNYQLMQSLFRNFGGHEKAKLRLITYLTRNSDIQENTIVKPGALDLIVRNVQDSSNEMSVHIARHLMILNRSLIGLQLLNRHVKGRLNERMGWTVLFGSCFPGDLQVTAVTRKLRQVEQAIRRGGVLILCHAEQLFESLYIVLNQQYWAQGDVTMTQIALGPSIRAIALPKGPFRIIALQDTDAALSKQLMSPAVLSRFEKHELRPHNLLNEIGRELLAKLEAHPIWSAMSQVKWRNLVFGFHDDQLASLALHLQTHEEHEVAPTVESNQKKTFHAYANANAVVMQAANAMSMIKFERIAELARADTAVRTSGQFYRKAFVFEGLYDALERIKSKRIVVMTNTQRHVEVFLKTNNSKPHFTIQLFEIQSELELDGILSSLKEDQLNDPNFCLVIQYDAATGPIEQYQYTKYEIDAKLGGAACKIVFTVHLDPVSVNNRWIFSFGDGWDYAFVDELHVHQRISLKSLVLEGQPIGHLIKSMTLSHFKNLLLEMLGPVLQMPLQNLGSNIGLVFQGVRAALRLPDSDRVVVFLKECLRAQLDEYQVVWNILSAIDDPHFDASSSLSEGLWEVFKQKISKPLAHLLLISDVWRVSDVQNLDIWCRFIADNYDDFLLLSNYTTALVQMPAGIKNCNQPFGRLFLQLDKNFAKTSDSKMMSLLRWLLGHLTKCDDQETRNAYFCDWMSLHLSPHLRSLISSLPLMKMSNITKQLFSEPIQFVDDWFTREGEITTALEHIKLLSDTCNDRQAFTRSLETLPHISNWKVFVDSIVGQVLRSLKGLDMVKNTASFLRIVTSIETCPSMVEVIERSKSLPELWVQLRITKRMFLYNPNCERKLYELRDSTPDTIIESMRNLVVNSLVQPHFSPGAGNRVELAELLISVASYQTLEELDDAIEVCPKTKTLLFAEKLEKGGRCPKCNEHLIVTQQSENKISKHLKKPERQVTESLFQDLQKFQLLFQQTFEIFIEHKKNSPDQISNLLKQLIVSKCKLPISWRYFTVISKGILKKLKGTELIDKLLEIIPCDRHSSRLHFNAVNLLRALVACADDDVKLEENLDVDSVSWDHAMLDGKWSVERVHHLARIRRVLLEGDTSTALDALDEWADCIRNEADRQTTEAFLFFVLRFASREGDEVNLNAIINHPDAPQELDNHEIIENYKESYAPMALGFNLQPVNGQAKKVQDNFKLQTRVNELLPCYDRLHAIEPDWAPYIARLAVHAADVARTKKIDFLTTLAHDPGRAADLYLPGVDSHPYLASYLISCANTNEGCWYVCDCETLCCVVNCGRVTGNTKCGGCGKCLAAGYDQPRPGVRKATSEDFAPPRGIHIMRQPATTPAYSVRNQKPIVTRLALLLDTLCLLYALITAQLSSAVVQRLIQSLPLTERINRTTQPDDQTSLLQIFCQHVLVHLDFFCKLLIIKPLTRADQFRIAHLLLNEILTATDSALASLQTSAYATSVSARERFEETLDRFINGQNGLANDLEQIDAGPIKALKDALKRNESTYWMYTRRALSSRESVQLALERDADLKEELQFLNLLLDDDVWAPKLEALVYLGNAARFVALVRTTLQGKFTKEQAQYMSIADGLKNVIEALNETPVMLGRGYLIRTKDHVHELFEGFKQLWKRFGEMRNGDQRTFLETFECQEIGERVRPELVLSEDAPLMLILAGNNSAETNFSCQLIANAVEAANMIAQLPFISSLCRQGTQGTRIDCSSAAGMANFDESLYAHVSRQEVDSFIVDHVIDNSTLKLAEYYAMVTVLGSTGSTIVQGLIFDSIPEFFFKEAEESVNILLDIERRFTAWQPTILSNQIKEQILATLEKNRLLAEGKSLLVSVLTHLITTTEPLITNRVRTTYISAVIQDLMDDGILTKQHVSACTLDAFNTPVRLQVHQAVDLLKSIMVRMRGDIFGGRIPPGWDVMLSERLVRETRETLREHAGNGIANTLADIAGVIQNNLSSGQQAPAYLAPNESLLQTIRNLEANEGWIGIPADLTLANLGHALLIAEAIQAV